MNNYKYFFKTFCAIVLTFFCVTFINSQTHDYAKAQYLSTYFLGGQRCGDTDSWLHGACHTTDGQYVRADLDLTGGWHDCGDYIKFHVTAPYAAMIYLYGFDKYPEAYADDYSPFKSEQPPNGIPDVLDEVKIETDYLIRCIDGLNIYWQVGGMHDYGEDHDSFSEPVTNSSELLYSNETSAIRPAYVATEAHSNALGDAASALALMSILYEPYDASYALSCKTAAITYYTTAKINASGTADYDVLAYEFMADADFEDNMGLAAALLYRATGTASYLVDAENYASGLGSYESFDYSNLNSLLFMELYHITATTSYLTNVGNLVGVMSNASCGYFHNTGWGSLRDAGNAALIASLYHQQTGNQASYDFAKSNVDFTLGSHGYISDDAPANMSFLIGYDELATDSYPKYPHHAAAFGKTTNAWTDYITEEANPGSVLYAYELKGALAGGPEASCSTFIDNIGNFKSSEYCTYYNGAFTGAVAYINKIENNLTLSVDDDIFENEFRIFPNPTNDFIKIEGNLIEKEIIVYNSLSQVIYKILPNENSLRIDLESYSKGIYFLKIKDSKSIKVMTIVKY